MVDTIYVVGGLAALGYVGLVAAPSLARRWLDNRPPNPYDAAAADITDKLIHVKQIGDMYRVWHAGVDAEGRRIRYDDPEATLIHVNERGQHVPGLERVDSRVTERLGKVYVKDFVELRRGGFDEVINRIGLVGNGVDAAAFSISDIATQGREFVTFDLAFYRQR